MRWELKHLGAIVLINQPRRVDTEVLAERSAQGIVSVCVCVNVLTMAPVYTNMRNAQIEQQFHQALNFQ